MMKRSINNIWRGEDVIILGGGSSLLAHVPNNVKGVIKKYNISPVHYAPFFKNIRRKKVIGINVAYQLGDWVDVCFFGDPGFHTISKHKLKEYKGMLISSHISYKADKRVMYIEQEKGIGVSRTPNKIYWNYSSGATAIGLAAEMGAKRIFLMGFDMQGEHWHNEYIMTNKHAEDFKPNYVRFLKAFPPILRDLKEMNVEIYQIGPKTALSELIPNVSLNSLNYGNN